MALTLVALVWGSNSGEPSRGLAQVCFFFYGSQFRLDGGSGSPTRGVGGGGGGGGGCRGGAWWLGSVHLSLAWLGSCLLATAVTPRIEPTLY